MLLDGLVSSRDDNVIDAGDLAIFFGIILSQKQEMHIANAGARARLSSDPANVAVLAKPRLEQATRW